MLTLRTLAIAAATASFGIVGCAQTQTDHDAHHPDGTPALGMPTAMGGPGASMAHMDEQMETMQSMHDKMMQATTPEQRSALMAEHMKVMQDSMAMMDGMGPSGMMGKGDMGGMQGKRSRDDLMGRHDQMMEKRMQMMQATMQMMMDRMPTAAAKP